MADLTDAGFWAHRHVLVTGATGLLGTSLVEALLERDAHVVCIERDRDPRSRFHAEGLVERVIRCDGDVRDQSLLERILGEHEIQTVFHLAAQTIVGIAQRNPVSTLDTNIRGTWALLEACRRSPRVSEIVVASSDKAYGAQQELPYTETTPLQGRAPYDVSKSCADLIAQSYAASYDSPVVITRCGNFFGAGDLNFNRLVPGVIRDLLLGREPLIRSDGSLVRDYLHVDDGAVAYLTAAEGVSTRPDIAGQAFNFSLERPMTVLEMVELITRISGIERSPRILGEAAGEIPAQFLDATRARQQLGWEPAVGLEEGLRRTVPWYRDLLKVG